MHDQRLAGARLSEAMEVDRGRLRLKWTHIARRIDITVQHLLRIRTGAVPLTAFVASGIDRALEWPDGTASRVYSGEQDRTTLDVGAEPMPLPRLDEITDDELLEYFDHLVETKGLFEARKMLGLLLKHRPRPVPSGDPGEHDDRRRGEPGDALGGTA